MKCPICNKEQIDEEFPGDGLIKDEDDLYVHLKYSHDHKTICYFIAHNRC